MALSAQDRPRWRFTVDDLYAMVRAGILQEGEHIELIDGELLPMSPQGRPHMMVVVSLRRRLEAAYAGRAYAADHSPLRVDAHHLPEPDIVLYRGTIDPRSFSDEADDEPMLVVEVAATSQHQDAAKAALYARRSVPVYWLVDLVARTVTVHERPSAEGYRKLVVLGEDDTVALPESDESWHVGDLLPPANIPAG